MKKILYFPVLLVTLLLSFAITKSAKASHAVGGDLTYTYQGPNQYLLTFRFYRDCFGIPAPATVDICYQSTSCGQNGTVTLNPIPGTGLEIPPSPCLPVTVSTCQGGSGYGVQEWIFQGTVTLPMACSDWIFSFEQCCRNQQITNLQNPAGVGMYLSTKLDNLNYAINSSPFFNNIPVTQFCVNNQFYYNQQATDPDGDSLSYSLVAAEDAPLGCPMTPFNLLYNTGWTATDPVTTLNGFNLDPITGLISFIPTLQGVYVMCVKVEERRNGVLIGAVKRDIQLNVVANCIITIPTFDSTIYNNSLGQFVINAGCGDTSIILSFQNPIQCGSIVPTDIRATDPNGLPNPVMSATAINCQSGLTDSILVTFFYPFTAGTSYLFTKVGNDLNTFLSECGSQMPEFDSIAIIVQDTTPYVMAVQNVSCFFSQLTVNFLSDFTCNTIVSNATDFTFVDATGTNFPITSVTSNCNPALQYDYTNQLTFNFASGILGTGPYYLIVHTGSDANTVANRCGTFFNDGDTLAMFNVVNNIIVNLGPDITACASDPHPVLDAGNPGVTFTWYFNGTQTSNTTQTITADSSGQYIVICFYSGSCQGSDTINVTIVPAPSPNVGPDQSICAGDVPPTFNSNITGAGVTYQWYFNGFLLVGDTNQTLVPDTSLGSGNYSVIVNNGGSCNGTDDLNFTINPGLAPNVGPDLTICQNDPVILTANVTAASYQWFDQFGIIPGATGSTYLVNTGQPGIYTFGVIATGPCQGTDTMTLTINATPIVTLAGNTVACITDTLFASSVGTGTYQWYIDGTLTAITDSTFIIASPDGLPHIYTVVVSNGTCVDSTQLSVTVYPSAPTPTPANTAYCSGSAIPPLDAGVTGTGYQYLWSNGATTQTIVPNSAGTYTVTVSLGGGLCTASASATVTQVTTPQPSLSNVSLCPNDNYPVLNSNATGTTYQWLFNGNVIPNETNSTYQTSATLGAGTYSVNVTNTQGISCSGTASMTLTVNPAATVDPLSDQTICDGTSATFTATSPSPSPSFSWSTGVSATSIQVSTAGVYTVTVTDANGCKGSATVNLFIDAAPVITIVPSGDSTNTIKVCKIDAFPLLNASAVNAVSFNWTYQNNSVSTSSSYQVATGAYGTYTVEVVNTNNCRSSKDVIIGEDPCQLIIPNVITPNGDTHNQFFEIVNIDTHPGNNLKIFNRWGNKVFEATNYQNNWSGQDLPDGTYYYILTTVEQTYSGTITRIADVKK